MPTLAVPVEEAFALTSRVTLVRLREDFGPCPLRHQDVRLAAPGREPLGVTVTGVQYLEDVLRRALEDEGYRVTPAPDGSAHCIGAPSSLT